MSAHWADKIIQINTVNEMVYMYIKLSKQMRMILLSLLVKIIIQKAAMLLFFKNFILKTY